VIEQDHVRLHGSLVQLDKNQEVQRTYLTV
jgi:hypothetical protein